MATTIDQAFVEQFEAEVFIAYQRKGSKFRNTIRTVDQVVGDRTTFFKVGKGTATTKARHAQIPTMNLTHSNVECTLSDHFAADWVDKFDLLKTNIDEMQIVAASGAYALGRKTDELIIAALRTSTSTLTGTAGFDIVAAKAVLKFFGDNDVPDDGNRFVAVSPGAWNQLMDIAQFSSADYIGMDNLPWQTGTQARLWMNILWYMHSGLDKPSTTRKCLAYHKLAAGHAIGADVESDIGWVTTHHSWFVNNAMSMGAVLIDSTGVAIVDVTD